MTSIVHVHHEKKIRYADARKNKCNSRDQAGADQKQRAGIFSLLEASAAGRMENNATALKPTTRNTGSRQETL